MNDLYCSTCDNRRMFFAAIATPNYCDRCGGKLIPWDDDFVAYTNLAHLVPVARMPWSTS